MSLYNNRISVKSLTDTTGGRRIYDTAQSDINCSIQPMNDITASQAGFSLEKTVKVYIPKLVTIKTTDKLTDKDSIEYVVKGIKHYRNAGNVTHTEITAEIV